MYSVLIIISLAITYTKCSAPIIYESDLNFRIDPGSKTCIFEKGKSGQVLEIYYQVTDGQHGDLDISFDVKDPNGNKILSDYKKSQNSIIRDLEIDGDYAFCLDNTYSVMNSKLVFVYILIEDKENANTTTDETDVAAVDADGNEIAENAVLEWAGTDEEGNMYFIEVEQIADSLSRTLKHVVKARHLLDIYSATKSRDSYMAFEDTFIVDMWSGIQISVMIIVGMTQVYMIKKLFDRPCSDYKTMF